MKRNSQRRLILVLCLSMLAAGDLAAEMTRQPGVATGFPPFASTAYYLDCTITNVSAQFPDGPMIDEASVQNLTVTAYSVSANVSSLPGLEGVLPGMALRSTKSGISLQPNQTYVVRYTGLASTNSTAGDFIPAMVVVSATDAVRSKPGKVKGACNFWGGHYSFSFPLQTLSGESTF